MTEPCNPPGPGPLIQVRPEGSSADSSAGAAECSPPSAQTSGGFSGAPEADGMHTT
ncbi:hypothetical protein EMIHUDRAFT_259332 [Emiliania huxleyi CCMP1516]|uniref:Uncharacterized protein n=2 Tax=Emiliania huxleyi TaxID=2903 RepID=A0A0D3I1E3_EMIH1|nr:hypothetical protein EMIHUDRAFT_259332 [Emiliania huxleyi CCMP1516]EOD05078.1 hypothetical protein EMIHUDRAFT_259332 [Emiliania huxleyi CCMP1516]|eukprot:XP_005757507.1 hypothetical protein EMIHUDRAFT_259332 [Emiliania huxleyi CCMP1516]